MDPVLNLPAVDLVLYLTAVDPVLYLTAVDLGDEDCLQNT